MLTRRLRTFGFAALLFAGSLIPSAVFAATLEVGPARTYTTIQSAIDAASAGDTIAIDAGVYEEYLSIDTTLALVGPNAGLAVGADRSAEATVMPPDAAAPRSGGYIVIPLVEIMATDVTIDGLALAGDNPDNTSGVELADGRTAEANAGVSAGTNDYPVSFGGVTAERIKVRSCVIDGFPGYGVSLMKAVEAGVSSWGNEIADNTIRNIRVRSDLYHGGYYPGICAYAFFNTYYRVERNVLDGMRGAYTECVEIDDGRDPAFAPAIRENTVTANIWGVAINPAINWGSPGRPYLVESNDIDMTLGNIGWRPSVGMLLSTMPDRWGTPTAPTVRDNVLLGGDYGYWSWSVSETMTAGPMTFEGGSVTSAGVGVMLTNVSYWWGEAGYLSASRVVVDSVEISGCVTGVMAEDPAALPWPPSWGVGTFSDVTIPVRIDLTGTTRIHGCEKGAVALGPLARVHSELVATGCNTIPWQELEGGDMTWTDVAIPSATVAPPGGTYRGGVEVSFTATHPVGACPKVRYSIDGGAPDTTYTAPIQLDPTATYNVRYVAFDEWGHESEESSATYSVLPVQRVERIDGRDRYDVAIEASQREFPASSVTTVVIASGAKFPDALSAASLAGLLDSPVLLTRPDRVEDRVLREIRRLGATDVAIVGGTPTIYRSVVTELRSEGFRVTRYGGWDRYEVAQRVAKRVLDETDGGTGQVFLVRGDVHWDALIVNPTAYHSRIPLILTRPTSMPSYTKTALRDARVSDVLLIGDTRSVAPTIESAVHNYGNTVERIGTSSRYANGRLFAERAAIEGWVASPAYVGVASGEKWADGLCGGGAVGRNGGVLLLSGQASLHSESAAFISAHRNEIVDVRVFGGAVTLSEQVMADCRAALGL